MCQMCHTLGCMCHTLNIKIPHALYYACDQEFGMSKRACYGLRLRVRLHITPCPVANSAFCSQLLHSCGVDGRQVSQILVSMPMLVATASGHAVSPYRHRAILHKRGAVQTQTAGLVGLSANIANMECICFGHRVA